MTASNALVVASALAVVPAAYAAQRLVEAAWGMELDPALVAPSPHIALFWRVGVATVLAAGSAGPFYRLAERDLALAGRAAEALGMLAFVLLIVQTLLVP